MAHRVMTALIIASRTPSTRLARVTEARNLALHELLAPCPP